MTEKPKNPDDLEKHLNSKLFQKFLKKEGAKLSEVTVIPKLSPVKGQKEKRMEPDYNDSKRQNPRGQGGKTQNQKSLKRDQSPVFYSEDQHLAPHYLTPEVPDIPRRDPHYRNISYEDRPPRPREEEIFYYREDPREVPRDSELKGFSDYIPPGESFVYYEAYPDHPAPKPKPSQLIPYYPQVDPLVTINSNSLIKELEERLKDKEEEVSRQKSEIENARADLADLEEKLSSMSDLERRLKNMRVERDMLERKMRGLEDENQDLRRQVEIAREDVENARYRVEDVERANKGRIQDLEREVRGYKERVSDLERDLSREREKARSRRKDRDYDDHSNDFRDDYDYQRDQWDDKREKRSFYDEPRRSKKNDAYDDRATDEYQGYTSQGRGYNNKNASKGYSDREYQDQTYFDRDYQGGYNQKTESISQQVKAKVGATNSASISNVLNWGEKPKKNEEIVNIENKILSLQIERKKYEEELAKIPEHARKMAVIQRREDIESELALIHSNIANLKIKVKQLQYKGSN